MDEKAVEIGLEKETSTTKQKIILCILAAIVVFGLLANQMQKEFAVKAAVVNSIEKCHIAAMESVENCNSAIDIDVCWEYSFTPKTPDGIYDAGFDTLLYENLKPGTEYKVKVSLVDGKRITQAQERKIKSTTHHLNVD